MSKSKSAWSACIIAAVAALAMGACHRVAPAEAPPPQAYHDQAAPDLAGGPPERSRPPASVGMVPLAPPTPAQQAWMRRHHWRPAPRDVLVSRSGPGGIEVVTSHPVPNPGYGHYRGRHGVSRRHHPMAGRHVARHYYAAPVRRAAPMHHRAAHAVARPAAPVTAAPQPAPRPAPKPAARPAPKPAPVAKTPAAPAPKPAAKPAPAPKPAPVAKAPAAPAPQAAAKAAKAPKPGSLEERLTQLGAALAEEMRSAKLDVDAAALADGKAGKVTLSLPATLMGSLKAEASRLGLRAQAKRASASATLSGSGYEITPNGAQTAVLDAGKPTSFSWQVKPTGEAAAPLTADVSGILRGQGKAQPFSLGQLTADVPALEPQKSAGSGFSLSKLKLPGHATVLGGIPSEWVVIGAVAILAVLLMVAIGRSMAGPAYRRRRRGSGAQPFDLSSPTQQT